ncbi:oligosaccharide flippase family protein [Dickeya oryzae]
MLVSCYTLVLGSVIFPVWLFQGKENMFLLAVSNIFAKLLSVPFVFFAYC